MKNTRQKILFSTQKLFALAGPEGISMRTIAKETGLAVSVIYHYFETKEQLFLEMYLQANQQLGTERAKLKPLPTFEQQLKQRIEFQFQCAQPIIAVLKYYLTFRSQFEKNERGHLPEKTYLHIEEILLEAVESGYFTHRLPIEQESKVIVHAINGFVLEYFPATINKREQKDMIELITSFIMRALSTYRRKNEKA